jgi:hypothetical protein
MTCQIISIVTVSGKKKLWGKMGEKLIELVRKCEELYDVSNNKNSDSVWKEKIVGKNRRRVGKIR